MPISNPPFNILGNAATATKLATGRTIAITGPITYTSPSFDGSGNITAACSVAAQTGTGSTFVMDTSPVLVTPNIGVANGASLLINGTNTTTDYQLQVSGTQNNNTASPTAIQIFTSLNGGAATTTLLGVQQQCTFAPVVSSVVEYGLLQIATQNSAFAPGYMVGILARTDLGAAALTGTITAAFGIQIGAPLINAAATQNITSYTGVSVANATQGALQTITNILAFQGSQAAGTNRWNLYMDGTAQNYIAGKLGIGISVPGSHLHISAANPSITMSNSSASSCYIRYTSNGRDTWLAGTSITVASEFEFYNETTGAGTKFSISSIGDLTAIGKIKKYNNIATAGTGVPVIYSSGRSAAATAAVASVATYTLPATDGTFEVSANVLVTTATLHSFNVSVDYTDEGNTARNLVLNFSTLAGVISNAPIANAGGAVPYEGVPMHIRCKASTAITIKTTGTFTTVTYNVEGIIRQLA